MNLFPFPPPPLLKHPPSEWKRQCKVKESKLTGRMTHAAIVTVCTLARRPISWCLNNLFSLCFSSATFSWSKRDCLTCKTLVTRPHQFAPRKRGVKKLTDSCRYVMTLSACFALAANLRTPLLEGTTASFCDWLPKAESLLGSGAHCDMSRDEIVWGLIIGLSPANKSSCAWHCCVTALDIFAHKRGRGNSPMTISILLSNGHTGKSVAPLCLEASRAQNRCSIWCTLLSTVFRSRSLPCLAFANQQQQALTARYSWGRERETTHDSSCTYCVLRIVVILAITCGCVWLCLLWYSSPWKSSTKDHSRRHSWSDQLWPNGSKPLSACTPSSEVCEFWEFVGMSCFLVELFTVKPFVPKPNKKKSDTFPMGGGPHFLWPDTSVNMGGGSMNLIARTGSVLTLCLLPFHLPLARLHL